MVDLRNHGVTCSECHESDFILLCRKCTPKDVFHPPCPSCAAKDARIALLEKVIRDTIPPLKAREEEDGSTDYLIPELEAALRSLEGK
jgi:hypothetical protein